MVFSQKPGTAKIGAVLLLISFIIALVGTLSPSWYKSRNSTSGIWTFCLGPEEFENCDSLSLASLPDWYYAVLSLSAIGVIFLFISTIAAFCATSRAVAAILGILGGKYSSLIYCKKNYDK
ncbi:hypothetical protein SNE40_019009 [Patella caerulea]|uniref:Uncharacterized protein n=1 Tax=Patella caerulea TaxID=87958 RepID=A0AAN8J7U8_PATCE